MGVPHTYRTPLKNALRYVRKGHTQASASKKFGFDKSLISRAMQGDRNIGAKPGKKTSFKGGRAIRANTALAPLATLI